MILRLAVVSKLQIKLNGNKHSGQNDVKMLNETC